MYYARVPVRTFAPITVFSKRLPVGPVGPVRSAPETCIYGGTTSPRPRKACSLGPRWRTETRFSDCTAGSFRCRSWEQFVGLEKRREEKSRAEVWTTWSHCKTYKCTKNLIFRNDRQFQQSCRHRWTLSFKRPFRIDVDTAAGIHWQSTTAAK